VSNFRPVPRVSVASGGEPNWEPTSEGAGRRQARAARENQNEEFKPGGVKTSPESRFLLVSAKSGRGTDRHATALLTRGAAAPGRPGRARPTAGSGQCMAWRARARQLRRRPGPGAVPAAAGARVVTRAYPARRAPGADLTGRVERTSLRIHGRAMSCSAHFSSPTIPTKSPLAAGLVMSEDRKNQHALRYRPLPDAQALPCSAPGCRPIRLAAIRDSPNSGPSLTG
jgi:hypothetical protein